MSSKWLVFGLLYAGFAANLMCRSNLDAVLPVLTQERPVGLSWSTAQRGGILFAGTFGYLLGKPFLGLAIDRFERAGIYFGGMLLASALANVLFGLVSDSFRAAMLVWLANRFVQAGMWAALAKLAYMWSNRSSFNRVLSVLSTSSRVGSIVGLNVSGRLLATSASWRAVFWTNGSIAAVVALICIWLLRERRDQDGSEDLVGTHISIASDSDSSDGEHDNQFEHIEHIVSSPPTLKAILCQSPRFLWTAMAVAGMTPITEYQSLVSSFLVAAVGVDAPHAAQWASVFPGSSVAGVLLAGFVADRLDRRGQRLLFTSSLVVAALSCLLLASAAYMGQILRPGSPWPLPMALVGLVCLGGSISGAFYLPPTAIALELGGRRHGAFLTAVFDAIGYAGALLMIAMTTALSSLDHGFVLISLLLMTLALLSAFTMNKALSDV